MSKVYTILSLEDRRHLSAVLMDQQKVPFGTRVHFTGGKRTAGQNVRMWGTLTTLSEQVEWHGIKLEPEDWKALFTAALKTARIVPNLDGNGFVVLGLSTSNMSREGLDNLQELIYEFGAKNGVTFKEPRDPPGLAPAGPERQRFARADRRQDDWMNAAPEHDAPEVF